MARDEDRPDTDAPAAEEAERKRITEVWGELITSATRTGMTLGRTTTGHAKDLESWLRSLPTSTIQTTASDPRSTVVFDTSGRTAPASEDPVADPLAGSTMRGDAAPDDPLAGSTMREGAAPSDPLAGSTVQGGASPDPLSGATVQGSAAGGDPLAGSTMQGAGAGGDPLAGSTMRGGTADASGEPAATQARSERPEFRIEGTVASGGMGEVLVARQLGLNRLVAVKRPHDEMLLDDNQLTAFVREGTVTGGLEHPSIVPVYQNGIDAEGRPYYAMKLVNGVEWRFLLHPDLAAKRADERVAAAAKERARGMEISDHIEILMKVCDAVAYAHSRHVIHRDLKPENVMVGNYGEVQLMDWGLAGDVRTDAAEDTSVLPRVDLSEPCGTPAYMAPEMALLKADRIGLRTDVYLLGGILYEIITGVAPHSAPEVAKALVLAGTNRIPHPLRRNPDAPEGLARIAMKALSTDPADRHESVAAFQDSIREYLRHAQSMQIADRAGAALARLQDGASSTGVAGTRYLEYAEVAGSFRQALELWSDNERAREGLALTLVASVEAAMAGGDLGLARAQFDQLTAGASADDQRASDLSVRLARQEARHRRRRRYFGLAVGMAALLLIALVGGGLFSYQRIRSERDEAERQRTRAETNLTLAEKRRIEAERNRRVADTQRSRAEENSRLAEQRHEEAEAARKTAQDNYELAERRRTEAERQRLEALRNLAGVDLQRAESRVEADRDYPVAALYVVRAIRTMGAADTGELRRRLAQLMQSSPRLQREVEVADVCVAVRFDRGDGALRVLLRNGTVWRPGAADAAGPASNAVSFAQWDGGWLVCTRKGNLYHDGTRFSLPVLDGAAASCVASDAAGRMLAVGTQDGRVVLLDAQAGDEPRFVATAHKRRTLCAAFLPGSGAIATAGADGVVALRDGTTGTLLRSTRAHAGFVGALAVCRDGAHIATAGADGTVRVWATADLTERVSFAGHRREVAALAFHPSRPMLASQSWDGTVGLWDYSTSTGARVATLHVDRSTDALSLSFAPDGRRLACVAGTGRVRIWDVSDRADATDAKWAGLRARGGRIMAGPGGEVVIACDDATYSLRPGAGVVRRRDGTRLLSLSPTGAPDERLAVYADGTLVRWGSGEKVGRVEHRLVAASQHGAYVALGTASGDVLLGKRTAAAPRLQRVASVAGLARLAVDGQTGLVAALGASGNVVMIDANRHAETVSGLAANRTRDVTWRPGTRQFILHGKPRVMAIVDAARRERVARLEGHAAMVMAVSIEPTGRWMASGGADGRIILWDLSDLSSTTLVSGLGRWVEDVHMSDDGAFVVCLLDDGTPRRFRIPKPDLASDVDALERTVKARLGIDRLPRHGDGERARAP